MSELLTRAAGKPTTLDRTARTVEAIACSGPAPAVRPGPAPDGSPAPWIEELDPAGADLAALTGAAVLWDHEPTARSAVGTVAAARLERGQVVATIKFDPTQDADQMLARVESGSVKGVSVGYRVQHWVAAGVRAGRKVFRAAVWRAEELSLCPLPLDSGALIRSASMAGTAATTATTEAAGTAAPPTATTEAAPVLTRADTNRTIRSIATAAGLPAAWSDDLIDRGADADEARRLAFEAMSKRSQPIDNRAPAGSIMVGTDNTDPSVIRRRMADALAHRLAPAHVKLEGGAVGYRSHSVLAMVGQLAAARGERVDPFDTDALLQRAVGAHSTSDFPLLLADSANKALLAQYEAAAPTYRQIAAPKDFRDFKAHSFLRLGDFPNFQEIGEGGPPNFGTIDENREQVTAKEFGTGIAINRKALINDDLNALSDFSSLIAIRAAQFENGKVYALLATNGPVLSDGHNLFATEHGNKAAAGTTIANGVAAAVKAIRNQTGLNGAKLNLRPRFLVVGPDKEVEARQVLAEITPTTTAAVNVWSGAFELIVDSEIAGNAWFLMCDPAAVPTLVFGYVRGATGPQISTETDFGTRAVKVAAHLDFAAGVVDYRGAYANAGA